MITTVSHKMADLLVRENVIEKEYIEVYVYGIELFLSSVISILIMLFTTILFNRIVEGLLFYIVFCITRLFCGGYHAKSYMGCKAVFLIILFVALSLNEILRTVSLSLWMVMWGYYTLVVFYFAPIENENKPLEEDEKKKYKTISIILSFLWMLTEGLLYRLQRKFMGIIPITLALIATLMLFEIMQWQKSVWTQQRKHVVLHHGGTVINPKNRNC